MLHVYHWIKRNNMMEEETEVWVSVLQFPLRYSKLVSFKVCRENWLSKKIMILLIASFHFSIITHWLLTIPPLRLHYPGKHLDMDLMVNRSALVLEVDVTSCWGADLKGFFLTDCFSISRRRDQFVLFSTELIPLHHCVTIFLEIAIPRE